ncbi:Uncharacterised protein [uncultured archaeon]|nr:Uncharacterised protein [uncultured archaeon]
MARQESKFQVYGWCLANGARLLEPWIVQGFTMHWQRICMYAAKMDRFSQPVSMLKNIVT